MLSVIPTEPPASVWRKLWPYVRPYKQALGMGVLLLLATNALDKTIPWLLQLAIDALNAGQFSQVQQAALAITGCALAMAAVRTLSRMRIFYVGRKVEHDLRGSVLDQLHRLGSSFFMRMPTGDIMSRAINDVTQVRLLVGFGLLNLVNAIFAYVLTLGLMLAIAPGLTVIALAPYPVLALGARAFGRAIHRRSLEQQRSLGHLSERVQDNLAGMRVVRAFGIEAAEIARFETANQRALRANMALVLLRALMWPVLMGLSALATLLVIWLGARRVLAGELSVGELVRFYAYVAQLFWPTLGLGYILAVIQRGTASFGRIREILDAAPSVPEAPHPKTPKGPGEVRVENLWFRFGDANTHAAQDAGPTRGDGVAPAADGTATAAAEGAATAAAEGAALKGVTLRAEPRRMLAVVGRTGSGKSTLAALLPRLSPTPPGTVFLDGEDITTLRLRDLRRTVGYAPQDAFLFSASVADNIGFGLDDGTEDRDTRIRSAARAAGVLHEIEALPQGFATQVGERGVQLSGGQRQRVALARALAIDPQVLVLDDPLSAVDARTEAAILDALERAGRARTLVLVTHRIAAARRADHIVVLDRGRVVEQGDHPSLMRRRGIYARLAEQQRLRAALEQTA